MGAGISITSGIVTLNPFPIQIGAGVSLWAVGRAIYKTAVAIDDYNDCIGGGSDYEYNRVRMPCDTCNE